MNPRHQKPHSAGLWLRRRGFPLAMIAILSVILQAGECAKESPFYSPVGLGLGPQPTTGTVTGTVTLDGSPAEAGVTVALDGRTAMTDANGMFSFSMVEQGSYEVTASFSGAECPPQTTTVSPNMTSTVTIPCTTTPTTGTVTGTVTSDGSPISGATVALDGRTTTTDGSGMFTFTDVTPGTYSVTVTLTGFQCGPQTTMLAAGGTVTVTVTCTVTPPSGSEIAAVTYSLTGTIVGADGCGLGMTISNPGPIIFRFDPATNTLTGESDTDAEGMYVPGQEWMGMGETTISSGTSTFTLKETITGTWERVGDMIVLMGTLRFEIFDPSSGGTKVCESLYDATYAQLAASSHRFKTGVSYLLPGGATLLGLRPVAFRYRSPMATRRSRASA